MKMGRRRTWVRRNETSYEYSGGSGKKNTVGNSITTKNWTNVKGETDGARSEVGGEYSLYCKGIHAITEAEYILYVHAGQREIHAE